MRFFTFSSQLVINKSSEDKDGNAWANNLVNFYRKLCDLAILECKNYNNLCDKR